MKIRRHHAQAGFSIAEVMVATTVAMLLLFGALYGTGETFAVVREGDARVHTQVHARRILDRLLKDCRYASELEIVGDAETQWIINITPGGTASPLTWTWTSANQELLLADNQDSETVLQGLNTFRLKTITEWVDEEEVVVQVSVEWNLSVNAGSETGAATLNRTIDLGAATWVRSHVR